MAKKPEVNQDTAKPEEPKATNYDLTTGKVLSDAEAAEMKPEFYTGVTGQTPAQVPSIGRIVHYRLTVEDAQRINAVRKKAMADMRSKTSDRSAEPARIGNEAVADAILPMIITAVWGDTPTSSVNGQVFLDGNDSIWVTSRSCGDTSGTWAWPAR